MLDGAEGLNSVVASLAAQGMTMLDTIRSGLHVEPVGKPSALAPLNQKPSSAA